MTDRGRERSACLPAGGGGPLSDAQLTAAFREFRDDPFGSRSPVLTRLLNVLRSRPMDGKYCLVCTQPHREWRLAILSGERGVAPRVDHNRVFLSLAEAEWAIFKLRWRDLTGQEIDEASL